jgi:hypothetical protein
LLLSAAIPTKAAVYPVGRPHGICHVTGHAIAPGEAYFAALRETPEGFERLEFAAAAWAQWPAPEKAGLLAFWRATMPAADESRDKRRILVDDEVLLELFRRLAEVTEPEKLAFRFMLGLILMRKKKLVFEGSLRDSLGRELWRVRLRKEDGTGFEMIDPKLSEAQLEEVGRQIEQILFGGIEEDALSGGGQGETA